MPRYTTIEALVEAITSVTLCEQFMQRDTTFRLRGCQTAQTIEHLTDYKVLLTRRLDEIVRYKRIMNEDVRFRVVRLSDGATLKEESAFGAVYNYWFSQTNMDDLVIRTGKQYGD